MSLAIKRKFIINLMVFFIILITPLYEVFAGDNVVVIANSFSGKKLTNSDVEDIFTLRTKKWGNGVPVKVYILSRDNPRTQEFILKFLGMTPNRYFDLLDNKEFSGKGSVDTLESEYSIMIKVLTTPGGIGYVSESFLTNFSGDVIILK